MNTWFAIKRLGRDHLAPLVMYVLVTLTGVAWPVSEAYAGKVTVVVDDAQVKRDIVSALQVLEFAFPGRGNMPGIRDGIEFKEGTNGGTAKAAVSISKGVLDEIIIAGAAFEASMFAFDRLLDLAGLAGLDKIKYVGRVLKSALESETPQDFAVKVAKQGVDKLLKENGLPEIGQEGFNQLFDAISKLVAEKVNGIEFGEPYIHPICGDGHIIIQGLQGNLVQLVVTLIDCGGKGIAQNDPLGSFLVSLTMPVKFDITGDDQDIKLLLRLEPSTVTVIDAARPDKEEPSTNTVIDAPRPDKEDSEEPAPDPAIAEEKRQWEADREKRQADNGECLSKCSEEDIVYDKLFYAALGAWSRLANQKKLLDKNKQSANTMQDHYNDKLLPAYKRHRADYRRAVERRKDEYARMKRAESEGDEQGRLAHQENLETTKKTLVLWKETVNKHYQILSQRKSEYREAKSKAAQARRKYNSLLDDHKTTESDFKKAKTAFDTCIEKCRQDAGNWSGTWGVGTGRVTLTQHGSVVTGHYGNSQTGYEFGTISGTVSGDTLSGEYSRPGYRPGEDPNKIYNGSFTWTIAADHQSFTGTWGGGPAGAWSGKRL